MKTLQIIGDSKYGGATYLILKWCEFLVNNNWQVDVLTTDERTKNALAQIPGINILDSIYIPRDIQMKKDATAFFSLSRLLRNNAYDVVHTYSATPSVIGRVAARLAGVKRIYHHQAAWTIFESNHFIIRWVYRIVEYLAVCCSTKSICVSKSVYEQAMSLHLAPHHRLVAICNGIDPQPYNSQSNEHRLRNELGLSKDSILLGSTGRLAKLKDIASIIKAIAILNETRYQSQVQLILAGDGDERENLIEIAKRHRVLSCVHFIGFVENIPGLLSEIDIFVSASLREGLSISIMEAMAAAKPIVATSILPNIELIEMHLNESPKNLMII